jgi:hypothetical protein
VQAAGLQGLLVPALPGRRSRWGRAAQHGRCSSSMHSSRGAALSRHPRHPVLLVALQCTWATEVRVHQDGSMLAACCWQSSL